MGLIPGQGTRSHMLQLKILNVAMKSSCASAKTQHSQNKLILKKKKNLEWYLLLIPKPILSYQLQVGPLSLDSVCTEHEIHNYDQIKNK